jgi:predicted membrane protein
LKIRDARGASDGRRSNMPLNQEVNVDYIIRFIAGGAVVSVFAVLGDLLRPKSFAGLFGAAPSVALATLTLAFWKEGPEYVAAEGRSMVLGALALALYSIVVCQLMVRARMSALTATICAMAVWLAGALSLKQLLVG